MTLVKFGNHILEKKAAASLERASASRGKRIAFTGTLSAYRSRNHQKALYEAYKAGKGSQAAPPGYSLHEQGLAIDIDSSSREWLAKHPEFGWIRTLSNEPWHFEYQATKDRYRYVRILSKGSRGPDVGVLQKALNQAGAEIDVDNVFGNETRTAVRAYQKKKKLKVDGIAGPATRASLGI